VKRAKDFAAIRNLLDHDRSRRTSDQTLGQGERLAWRERRPMPPDSQHQIVIVNNGWQGFPLLAQA
jgi:hypothetical protein